MKLSIILPTVDWPPGSGKAHPWLSECLKSVMAGGHQDFECLVGCDGDVEDVRSVVELSMKDDRFRYIPFPVTHSWGNYQRHHLMKEYATGDYFSFMDHDDSYTKGALAVIAEEADVFPGRVLRFKTRLVPAIVKSTGQRVNRLCVISTQAIVVPNAPWVPDWNPDSERKRDIDFYLEVSRIAKARNEIALGLPAVIAQIRPWVIDPEELSDDLKTVLGSGCVWSNMGAVEVTEV